MTHIDLVLAGAVLIGASGVAALACRRGGAAGERLASLLAIAGGALGATGAWLALWSGEQSLLAGSWAFAPGRFALGLDPLSACFLVPVFVVPALGSFYGLGYWRESEHPSSARRLRAFYGLMPAGMALVLLARDGGLFLVAWEVMALSAFFLISAEDEKPEVRRSAWIYFIATHAGTLCLLAMFALLRSWTGSLAWDGQGLEAMPRGARDAVFVLALVGFGIKAGLVPLHVWLPPAHANSPSHVSAVLSGVVLKMGVYGVLRTLFLMPEVPMWWGVTLIGAGAASAFFGISFAVAQDDLKRLLAYSSIENVGIIFVGVGLACLGRSLDRPDLLLLGLGGALLHVWNHALFKPLLFFVAGSVLHATGWRRIDRLGGLAKRMPWTAALCVMGCCAACALPPFNGFASELLVYLGLLRTTSANGSSAWLVAPLCATTLALAGALAIAAYTKLSGLAFLGLARSDVAEKAHEVPPTMIVPAALLALACVLLGAVPWLVTGGLGQVSRGWMDRAAAGSMALGDLAPLRSLTAVAVAIWGLAAVVMAVLVRAMGRRARSGIGTWDCGYSRPTETMQYTGRSMSQFLVSLFSWMLRPNDRGSAILGLFPRSASFAQHVPDVVLDRLIVPATTITGRLFRRLRVLQQGQIQVYVLYILVAVVVMCVAAYVA